MKTNSATAKKKVQKSPKRPSAKRPSAKRPSAKGSQRKPTARKSAKASSPRPPKIKERLSETGEHLQEKFHEVADTTVEGVGKRADSYVEEAASRIREIEQTGHEAAEKLSQRHPKVLIQAIDCLADQIGDLANYFEHRDAREILDDTKQLVREHPVPTLGAIALVGVAAGRYLASESPGEGDSEH